MIDHIVDLEEGVSYDDIRLFEYVFYWSLWSVERYLYHDERIVFTAFSSKCHFSLHSARKNNHADNECVAALLLPLSNAGYSTSGFSLTEMPEYRPQYPDIGNNSGTSRGMFDCLSDTFISNLEGLKYNNKPI